ncbi:hypothetical protein N658DRAFT_497242 [Parathielavia hyrcaniae]|uniref:Uncharacterized protein n=1 Tax=Parathielavia hyrcaniae TaxID=113614 RepID=A0AAN6T170_9PEZI|nr:hypothetical protein N658DRAFT_497242 [Parathielavia hyrcaniae]
MVTTRRGARSSAVKHASSSGETSTESIPHQTIRRRAPAATPATLRPSRDPTVVIANAFKRKRGPSAASDLPQQKRQRQVAKVQDSIEVQGEDDDVDAAISATSTCRTAKFEVVLPTFRRPRKNDDSTSTKAPLEHATSTTTAPPLGAKRIRRHIQSVEITGGPLHPHGHRRGLGNAIGDADRETPRPDSRPHSPQLKDHAVEERRKEELAESLGSPELQSSALKRRSAKPLGDVYDLPEDEDSEATSPAPVPRPKTINGLGLRSQPQLARRTERTLPAPQQRGELSPLREEERTPPRNPAPSKYPPPLGDNEAHELVQRTNGPDQVQQETDESEESNESGDGQDTDDEAHAEDRRAQVPRRPGFVGIQVRPYVPAEPTIAVFSDHLNNMSEIMGRRGWTGEGRTWGPLFSTLEVEDQPPARTELGKILLGSLAILKDLLDEVPNAMDLAGQSRFLSEHQQDLQTAMSKVDRAVSNIESLPVRPDALMEHLSKCIIPMLVLVLRHAFALGTKEPDAVVNDLAADEGTFTWTTIQYLMFILGWVARLLKVLTPEASEPEDNNPISRFSRPYSVNNEKKNRELVDVMVRKWKQQLRASVDGFNEEVDAIRDRREKARGDARIKAAREAGEAAVLGRDRQQEMAFASSIQEITSRPRPMAEKFLKALHQSAFSLPSSQAATVTERSTPSTSTGTATSTGSRPSYSSAASRVLPPPAPPQNAVRHPALAEYPPWLEEDVEWFLLELRRPGGDSRSNLEVCAETLGRTLLEVRMEKERLRGLGQYRSPSRGR